MSELTVKEAERLRQIRAGQVNSVPTAAIADKLTLNAVFSSMRQAIENGTATEIPPSDEWREEAERLKRERWITALRSKWHAPARQLQLEIPDRTGEWGKTEARLKGNLGRGFLVALIGTRGCGKTQIAVELMRFETERLREARYTTAVEFFLRLRTSYRKKSEESEEEIIEDFAAPKLLVIDEVGRRGETEWENNMLFALIDRRYRDMNDTILISNQERDAFTASIGPSLASRMQETGGILECAWPSFRK